MRRLSAVGVGAVGVVLTAALMPFDVASASEVGWRQFEFDPAHSGHNWAESLLSPSNVDNLTLAYATHGLKGAAVTQPVVLGNVAYMGTGYLVVAFDVSHHGTGRPARLLRLPGAALDPPADVQPHRAHVLAGAGPS